MIKQIIKTSFLLVVLLFVGCGEDTPEVPAGKYESGVFVVNQGNFGNGTGTITYHDRDTLVLNDIYQSENTGLVLGNVAQSMTIANDKIYIAVNNAQKIEVVDANDFTQLATIEGLPQVRYMVSTDDGSTLYASSWGDGFSGVLYEIDTATDQIVSSTVLGGGLENMVIDGNDLFIAKSGGFGTDSVVLKYDIAQSELAQEFLVGDNPVGIGLDKDGDVIVLCTGAFDFSNPDNNTAGGIYKISNNTVELILEIANGSANMALDVDGDVVYYRDGEGIKQVNLSSPSSTLFTSGFFYGLGFDPVNDQIFVADAKDFASSGEVTVFNKQGVAMRSFTAGIIPGEFYFTN